MDKIITFLTAILLVPTMFAVDLKAIPIPDIRPNIELDTTTALDLIRSTVRIRYERGQGTGVVVWTGINKDDKRVRSTYIITNRHVASGEYGTDVEIESFAYLKDRNTIGVKRYEASIAFVSTQHDLSLIKLETSPDEKIDPVSIISQNDWDHVTLYQPLYLVSCGLGSPPYITNGNLSYVNRHETKFEFTTNTIFGSSGGGIYNEHGELIGLVHAIRVANMRGFSHPITHRAIGLPLPALIDALKGSGYEFVLEKAKEIDEDGEEEEEDWENEGFWKNFDDDWPDIPGFPELPEIPKSKTPKPLIPKKWH